MLVAGVIAVPAMAGLCIYGLFSLGEDIARGVQRARIRRSSR